MGNNDKRDMKWRTLSSEYLIRRPWLTARRDTVELPNGTVNDEYYVLEYPDWVNVVAITTGGDFVFVRQYRHGIDEVCHEIVAGVIEPGEQPEAAARRELEVLSPNPSTVTNIVHCFVATGVERTAAQHLDATEDIEVCLFSKDEVRQMLRRGEIMQALMAAPLWRLLAEGL